LPIILKLVFYVCIYNQFDTFTVYSFEIVSEELKIFYQNVNVRVYSLLKPLCYLYKKKYHNQKKKCNFASL